MRRMPLFLRAVAAMAALSGVAACWPDGGAEPIEISGDTMGTTYNIIVLDPSEGLTADALKGQVDAVLADVNAKMSNWDPTSEVSRFNASQSLDPIPVSADMAKVIARANDIHALSDGRFDITLAPLIDLWGFGPRAPGDPVPAEADIAAALAVVGQAEMLALGEDTLSKARPDVTVNLAAIAKGFGVDQVAAALQADGMGRYVVEIGGDLVANGTNFDDGPWTIGVERPDAGTRQLQAVVPLTDAGLATSGDYRNYVEQDGVRYSHILDPTTGYPIRHRTASVTAIAEDAMTADALATAFLALGAEAGLPIANANGLALMFISRADGGFVTEVSDAFPELLSDTP